MIEIMVLLNRKRSCTYWVSKAFDKVSCGVCGGQREAHGLIQYVDSQVADAESPTLQEGAVWLSVSMTPAHSFLSVLKT